MRVEYINPFVESAYNVLKEVLNSEVNRGDLYLKSTSMPVLGVAAVVGLAGDVEGRVRDRKPRPLWTGLRLLHALHEPHPPLP